MASYNENDLRNIDNALYIVAGSFSFELLRRKAIFSYLRDLVRKCKLSNNKNFKKKFYFDKNFKRSTADNCLLKLCVIGKYNDAEKMIELLKSGSKTPNTACIVRKGIKYICTIIL